jgi:perosamine synthetase
MTVIPVFKPSYDQQEIEALKGPFSTGWIGLGPKTKEFEQKFAQFIGTKYAVGLNSGTAALHLAMRVMDVEGGEVITTPITFVSTNHAILYNDATPVFADVEEDTLNINPNEIEKLITRRTKAIVVVHYGGHACDMDSIMELACKHRLKVIEDCAHACGGSYNDQPIGSIGDIACFSFHAVKNLACGEGGMITLNNEDLDKRLRSLRWLGITKGTWDRAKVEAYSWFYNVEEVGYKAHMNDIPAVLGLVQLKKLVDLNNRRRKVVEEYNAAFSRLDWLKTPVEKSYTRSALHNYVVKVEQRDRFVQYMADKGVSTGVHYYPNHLYPVYKPFYRKLPVAESVWQKIVTLPLFPDLTPSQINYIIESVLGFSREI